MTEMNYQAKKISEMEFLVFLNIYQNFDWSIAETWKKSTNQNTDILLEMW